jgi:hypothetical protein
MKGLKEELRKLQIKPQWPQVERELRKWHGDKQTKESKTAKRPNKIKKEVTNER